MNNKLYCTFVKTEQVDNHIKYLTDTYRFATVDGATKLLVDELVPVDYKVAMTDSTLIKKALDSVYRYIEYSMCKFDCPDFEGRLDVRQDVMRGFLTIVRYHPLPGLWIGLTVSFRIMLCKVKRCHLMYRESLKLQSQ